MRLADALPGAECLIGLERWVSRGPADSESSLGAGVGRASWAERVMRAAPRQEGALSRETGHCRPTDRKGPAECSEAAREGELRPWMVWATGFLRGPRKPSSCPSRGKTWSHLLFEPT